MAGCHLRAFDAEVGQPVSASFGRYQLRSPSSAIAAGTRIERTMVASMQHRHRQTEAHLLEHRPAGRWRSRRRPRP